MLLASWSFYSFLKRFRSFNAKNLGSLGQRAAKWLAIKLWEWFDPGTTRIRADWFERGRGQSADIFLWPPTLTAGNFEALWPTDPKFSALKDLNLFKTVPKVQEASIILRVGFALSKWPHFNSIYLVRVPFLTRIAVFIHSSSTFLKSGVCYWYWHCPSG